MSKSEQYYNKAKHQDTWNVDVVYPNAVKNIMELSRLEGVLLGLSLAKKAFDKGHGRDDIYENEIIYREQLENLFNSLNTSTVSE